MKHDIIIVGGGLGGLVSGAKLAKEGKRVLLLEQHDRPGGCATTFNRKDFTMEVGLHEMDGLHPRDMKTKIFRDLALFDRVEFLEVPEFYRFKNGRYDIVIPHDPKEAAEILEKNFPSESAGIAAYFGDVINARGIVGSAIPGSDKSVGSWLDEIIKSDDLKLVLLGNLGYFHDNPYTLSYYYYITAQGSYYSGRANFIKGGSQKLSDALSDIIVENGGAVKLNSHVDAIIFKGDIASGVEYRSSRGRDKGFFTDLADEIIINSSIPGLARDLLPPAIGGPLLESLEGLETGASLLTVYFGFGRLLKEVGSHYYSTFIYDDSVVSQEDIFTNNHGDWDIRSFTFVDYSQVDSALAPEGKSVGAACCIDYLSDWEGLDRDKYRERKEWVAKAITGRMEKLIPGFADAIEFIEVATPVTVKRYTLNPGGAVYGFAQNPGKKSLYLEQLPGNMHIASAWGKFGGGFSGAIFSGYMTAIDILRKGRIAT